MASKEAWNKAIGHQIREDTYQLLERVVKGESYEDVKQDIEEHREQYNISTKIILTSEETIYKYLAQINLVELGLIDINIDMEKIAQANKRQRKSYKEFENKYGIYGIYVNNTIVYIGQALDFKVRFQEHYTRFNHSDSPLYRYLRRCKEQGDIVSCKILVNVPDLKTTRPIQNYELQAMELALIEVFKPRFNVQGISQNYIFTKEEKEKLNSKVANYKMEQRNEKTK